MNRRVEEQANIDPAEVQAKLPLGRYATATEIAKIVEFLALRRGRLCFGHGPAR